MLTVLIKNRFNVFYLLLAFRFCAKALKTKIIKRYGLKNDPWDDGDKLSNTNNAVKSSYARTDGKGALRSSKLKRRLRTVMNKRKRALLKRELVSAVANER